MCVYILYIFVTSCIDKIRPLSSHQMFMFCLHNFLDLDSDRKQSVCIIDCSLQNIGTRIRHDSSRTTWSPKVNFLNLLVSDTKTCREYREPLLLLVKFLSRLFANLPVRMRRSMRIGVTVSEARFTLQREDHYRRRLLLVADSDDTFTSEIKV